MPILAGIQRRNSQAGAIRCGDEIIGSNGKAQAHKLDKFRFTSHSQRELAQVAALWGGEVQPWNAGAWGAQWQVYTEVNEIPIALPPGDLVIRQDMELYTGGGLERRCDGRSMSRPRPGPCLCPQPGACPYPGVTPEVAEDWAIMERKRLAALKRPEGCKPLTRLSVSLPDISDIGVWVIRTRSEEAAAEIMGKALLMERARARGVFLAARIAIEQRRQMVGGVLRQYPVVVIRLDDSLRALADGTAGRTLAEQLPPAPGDARLAITAGVPSPRPAQQKIPTAQAIADAAAKATTRDQIEQMNGVAAEHGLAEDHVHIGNDVYEELRARLQARWRELPYAEAAAG